VKRSEINHILNTAKDFCNRMNFKLPPFAFWTPEQWKTKDSEYNEIRENMLGWDITDFGSNDFMKVGLTLFTLRNGNIKNPNNPKPYCEKLLIVREEQVTPLHFHNYKIEDIINRGGGNILCQVYCADEKEQLSKNPVPVNVDGRNFKVGAGTILRLKPGESITLFQKVYHEFWGEKDTGQVLSSEVSKVNDDHTDNRFFKPGGRFPKIEEDHPPLHYLCNEYPPASD
jgi:D-lyxose ketol-isomerase